MTAINYFNSLHRSRFCVASLSPNLKSLYQLSSGPEVSFFAYFLKDVYQPRNGDGKALEFSLELPSGIPSASNLTCMLRFKL